MVSIKNLFSSALLATLALAQNATFASTDIASLATATASPSSNDRAAWCVSQRSLCTTLCGDRNNTCTPSTLDWTCVCPGNSTSAMVQFYSFSIVGNECNTLLGNCLSANANNLVQQQACQAKYICGNGTQADATAAGAAAAAATASTMASSSSAAASTAAAGATSSTHAAAAAAAYGEFAPPMFVMMFVGAIATFL